MAEGMGMGMGVSGRRGFQVAGSTWHLLVIGVFLAPCACKDGSSMPQSCCWGWDLPET